MTNILLKYLEDRYKHHSPAKEEKSFGPVITISRDFGCPANMCATDLAELLTKLERGEKEPWKVISKEILDQASNELGLSPEKIEFVFKFQKRSTVDEVLESLSSKYYKSERKIRNTIREVIRSIGEEGRVIIVGRAGSVILQDIPNSLHIKLTAPLDFRVEGVGRRHEISHTEARKLTNDMDKKRSQLRNEFTGKTIYKDDYDLIFNCQKFKVENIVSVIAKAAEDHKLI
ncbi:MAG: cytidylate kinase-like family protein [Bacteroidales bacterium]|jgi:cytidylate kinase|nr:cytidylate kinase-like family protein [Bacteroidales bacterium]